MFTCGGQGVRKERNDGGLWFKICFILLLLLTFPYRNMCSRTFSCGDACQCRYIQEFVLGMLTTGLVCIN